MTSPWMTFGNILEKIHEQQGEGQGKSVYSGKGMLSWSCGHLDFPAEPTLVGTTGRSPDPASLFLLLGH